MAFVMQNATTAANGREIPRRRALCNIWATLRQENRNFRCKGDENAEMDRDRGIRVRYIEIGRGTLPLAICTICLGILVNYRRRRA
jgi:hypothetical protein